VKLGAISLPLSLVRFRWAAAPVALLLGGLVLLPLTQSRGPAIALFLPLCNLAAVAPENEAPFLDADDTAMNRMMADMTIQPTGDIDRDFVAMMVPHHEGAIGMALAMLRYGHNEKLRRMAQEIIVTQQQEITAMRLAIGEPAPPPAAPSQ
jgi:hypothetical protein